MGDKVFTKTYGDLMTYSYGCEPTQSDVYVYRMTLTDEDGHSIDYSFDDVVKRCNEIGVKTVPHIRTLMLNELGSNHSDSRDVMDKFVKSVEAWGSGPSRLDNRHIKEGVCVRIEGGISNRTFKFKSFEFKVLEGIVKDAGVIDAEEAQG